jgi:hypothetical protein
MDGWMVGRIDGWLEELMDCWMMKDDWMDG